MNSTNVRLARNSNVRRESVQSQYKKVTIVFAFLVGLAICAWFTINAGNSPQATYVLFLKGSHAPLKVVSDRFLSVGLDASVLAEKFKNFDMKNKRLRTMVRHLRPGYLRVGGTLADRLKFDPKQGKPIKYKYVAVQDGDYCSYESVDCDVNVRPNFTFSGDEWSSLYEFAVNTGLKIIFDLNALTRHPDGTWDSDNAKEMINYSNYYRMDVGWELGNEPNSFHHVFNYTVPPMQLADDYVHLRNILNKYKRYRNCTLVGPSITRPRPENEESIDYLKHFLTHLPHGTISAVTWHQYYFNGRTATGDDFVDTDIFNLLIAQTDLIEALVHDRYPVWLGETAAAYGGGAPGYNNRYIGTFIWLDKLGVSARMGLEVVVRQSIFKGFYALIEGENYEPTPDYWISVFFKQLVGPEVLPCYSASAPEVRLYCHCSNRNNWNLTKSAITVYGMNMKNTEAVVRLQGFSSTPLETVYAYVLTPRFTLLSRGIDLNRKLLDLTPEGELPVLKPKILRDVERVVMPPFSTAFYVIPTDYEVCKRS